MFTLRSVFDRVKSWVTTFREPHPPHRHSSLDTASIIECLHELEDDFVEDPTAPPLEDLIKTMHKDVIELRIGGGAAVGAFSFPGTYRRMIEDGLDPQNLSVVTGISIGALLSLGVVLGLTPHDMEIMLKTTETGRLQDMSWRAVLGLTGNILYSLGDQMRHGIFLPLFGLLFRGLGGLCRWVANLFGDSPQESWGILEGHEMKKFVNSVIRERTGLENPTFRELAEYLEKEKGHRVNLRIVTSQVCCGQQRIWDKDNDPEQEIIPILLASMSVPLAYQPFIHEGHVHSDGGIRSNNPPRSPHIDPEQSLSVMFCDPLQSTVQTRGIFHRSVRTIMDFLGSVIHLGYFYQVGFAQEEELNRIMRVTVDAVTATEFGASAEKKMACSEQGYRSAEYFAKFHARRLHETYHERQFERALQHLNKLMASTSAQTHRMSVGENHVSVDVGFHSEAVRDKVYQWMRHRLSGVGSTFATSSVDRAGLDPTEYQMQNAFKMREASDNKEHHLKVTLPTKNNVRLRTCGF